MEIDGYVIETLMPDLVGHDRHPAAFLVYILLWARTRDASGAWTSIALQEMAEGTGLSKRAVQTALKRLVQRRLVSVRREGITSVGDYRVERPWTRTART